MSMPFSDKTGQTFGFWKVFGFYGRNNQNKPIWTCRCICGKEKQVLIQSLMSGKSKSCGCMQYILSAEKNTKHGMAGSPTYKSWHAMIQRCKGEGGHQSYPDRGISIANDWIDFEKFHADMGDRPVGMTLDRIDNTKGYSRQNCRWATPTEQANNKMDTIYVIVDDVKMSFMDACRKFDIGESCARHRMRKGMSDQDIFKKPVKGKNNAGSLG